MNPATRRALNGSASVPTASAHDDSRNAETVRYARYPLASCGVAHAPAKIRVLIVAENSVQQHLLLRMLESAESVEFAGTFSKSTGLNFETLLDYRANVLLFSWTRNRPGDLALIQQLRMEAPELRILLLGAPLNQSEFLQCVRAGISGFLLQDATADEVLHAVRAVLEGEAVCPGTFSDVLFRYIQQEHLFLPSAAVQTRLGLTRREQQLIPFLAKGLTNKEIANHFSLSEQTVKNHIYRMKSKVGAENRLGIVHVYREQGFLI